jgi:hypothetical protein
MAGVSYFDLHSLGYVPKSGITRSYRRFIFRCLMILHTDFHSGCTSILASLSLCPCQLLLFVLDDCQSDRGEMES